MSPPTQDRACPGLSTTQPAQGPQCQPRKSGVPLNRWPPRTDRTHSSLEPVLLWAEGHHSSIQRGGQCCISGIFQNLHLVLSNHSCNKFQQPPDGHSHLPVTPTPATALLPSSPCPQGGPETDGRCGSSNQPAAASTHHPSDSTA